MNDELIRTLGTVDRPGGFCVAGERPGTLQGPTVEGFGKVRLVPDGRFGEAGDTDGRQRRAGAMAHRAPGTDCGHDGRDRAGRVRGAWENPAPGPAVNGRRGSWRRGKTRKKDPNARSGGNMEQQRQRFGTECS